MYPKFKNLKTHHQLIWSLVIVVSLVSIWRGVWGLMDAFIFPNNFLLSVITTLFAGIIMITVTHYKLK